VSKIDKVLPHPNADRLMLAHIGGWQCVVGKNADGTPARKEGDLVVFVPPDSIMPLALAEQVGVTKYLANKVDKVDKEGEKCLVVWANGIHGRGARATSEGAACAAGSHVSVARATRRRRGARGAGG
jgi:hypothetical protein